MSTLRSVGANAWASPRGAALQCGACSRTQLWLAWACRLAALQCSACERNFRALFWRSCLEKQVLEALAMSQKRARSAAPDYIRQHTHTYRQADRQTDRLSIGYDELALGRFSHW